MLFLHSNLSARVCTKKNENLFFVINQEIFIPNREIIIISKDLGRLGSSACVALLLCVVCFAVVCFVQFAAVAPHVKPLAWRVSAC